MEHWIMDNLFIFILAGFSGVDLIKRVSSWTKGVISSKYLQTCVVGGNHE